ncbi:MAG: TraR/DksA family transcriptional regulator [Rhodobacteraceae bacterium]|nr:TraR/DksA family transcriptional regulator [Paracoccaceae bacterium]
MDSNRLTQFRTGLEKLRAQIDQDDEMGRDGQKTVALDQQSVGRLSRMDALQQQAMAKATQARRGQMRQRIEAALVRMDEGEFGYCSECGEDIPIKRLDLDPTVPTCITCARG